MAFIMQPVVLVNDAAEMQAASAKPANLFQAQFDALRRRTPALRGEDVAARRARLQKLSAWLHAHRTDIQQALLADFRKPTAETDTPKSGPHWSSSSIPAATSKSGWPRAKWA